MQPQPDSTDVLTPRVFSFRDVVVRPPSSAKTHRHQEQSLVVKKQCKKEKRTLQQGPRTIRSRSIEKIVESRSFRKRCEALKSHSTRKHDELIGENGAWTSPSRRTTAHLEMVKQWTPLEELCEREQEVLCTNESFERRTRTARTMSSCSEARLSLERDDELDDKSLSSRLCVVSEDRVLVRHDSLTLGGTTFESDAHRRRSVSSSDSSSDQVDERGQLCKKTEMKEDIRCRRFSASQPRSPIASVSSSSRTSFSRSQGPVCAEERNLSSDVAVGCSTSSRYPTRKGLESDDDFLDCDDTNSESTAESSCPSPRHSLLSHFGSHRRCDVNEMEACQEDDELLSKLWKYKEEDEEAYMLLDRINNLSVEFVANREYEESNALSWSVQYAAQQGVISTPLQQNLLANICEGYLDDARDVLYHKCHLVPAVGGVMESPMQPTMDPSALQSFADSVNRISPTDLPEARMHKLHVLKQLSDLLTKWVKVIGRERELNEEHITLTKGSLFLAGSYRLGLDDPNSDIDAVCVTPWHVTHDDFFGSFCRLLERTAEVSHLAPVPNAYVPLISLSFLGVRMDLLFARLPVSSVESNQNIDSDHMLVGVNETSMKALNAPRVSSMLLCLVPRRRHYRIVLRAVRTWARCRGIYSAKLGYLGGISWAILVAFVCQLYPNAEPGTIFVRFFQVLSEWQWPQPVMLNMIYDAGLGFDMWDPRENVFDRSHIMPIITPAYPHMNSSVQVSQSTFSVLYEELWRARYLAEIAVGISKPLSTALLSPESSEADLKAAVVCMATSMPCFNQPLHAVDSTRGEPEAIPGIHEVGAWDKLFETSNFFIRYSSYMVFNFEASSEGAMHKWGMFVQSRIRKLVDSLYHISPVSRVHAYPRYFPHVRDVELLSPGSCMFIGIEFHSRRHEATQPKDDPEVKKTLEQTIRFFLATELQQMEDKQPDMTADANVVSWEDLPEVVFRSGRCHAAQARTKYMAALEHMGFFHCTTPLFRPPYYNASYNRHGKWRGGGPRRFAGGQRKRRDCRTGPRLHPAMEAG